VVVLESVQPTVKQKNVNLRKSRENLGKWIKRASCGSACIVNNAHEHLSTWLQHLLSDLNYALCGATLGGFWWIIRDVP
jgi:hypothetical protein